MKKLFTEHPESIGETYFQHFKVAGWFGIQMIFAGFASCLHAIFPFLFERTASSILLKLSKQFEQRAACSKKKD